MSEPPDLESSRGFNESRIQPEWDKNPPAGQNPVSDPATASRRSSHVSSSSKKRRGLRSKLRRHKHHEPSPDPEKSEIPQGDAENTSPASDAPPPVKKNIVVRFFLTAKEVLLSSWINVLLIFVPVGIAVNAVGANAGVIFAMNAIAIVPLAGLLAHATEVVAASLGDTLGALLNVSFGNAVELIIFIIALVKDEINIVQASLVGSILSNLLLILGMAFLLGGLRYREQIYNSTVTQMSACLLSLSVTSLLLPTAFHASFSNVETADDAVLKVSRGTSVILLIVYVLYLLFQLKSHSYLYESMPQERIDEEAVPGVLADVFNYSSSSDTSSSDNDSSSSSNDSHVTATKRIKRAFKNRRRRKSSASTAETPSLKSKTRSGSVATNQPPQITRSGSDGSAPITIETVLSGDEADIDANDNLRQTRSLDDVTVQHRDFGEEAVSIPSPGLDSTSPVQTAGPVSRSISFEKDEEPEPPKKKRHRFRRDKKQKEKGKKHKQKQQDEGMELAAVPAVGSIGVIPETTVPQNLGQMDGAGAARVVTPGTTGTRKPLVPIPTVRPQMQKMLSQTVFSSQYNAQAMVQATRPSVPRAPYGLRRTASLPGNMNQGRGTPRTAPAHMAHTAPDSRAATVVEEEKEDVPERKMSRTAAVILLLISTALVAVCAEFLVDSINDLVEESHITEAFIGLIILPIVGNAAEHVTAVTVAAKNKVDLAIGVAVGSSIQIALFVTPIVVLLGWILDKDMSLYFTLFETVSLFVSAFIVNFLVLDGRSNYLEGSLLCAAYTIIAVAAFFYPNCDASSGATCSGNDITTGT